VPLAPVKFRVCRGQVMWTTLSCQHVGIPCEILGPFAPYAQVHRRRHVKRVSASGKNRPAPSSLGVLRYSDGAPIWWSVAHPRISSTR